MPERVWLNPAANNEHMEGDVPYVPESRLREAEAERDAALAAMNADVADVVLDAAALRAERDALQADLARAEAERDEAQRSVEKWRRMYEGEYQLEKDLRFERDSLLGKVTALRADLAALTPLANAMVAIIDLTGSDRHIECDADTLAAARAVLERGEGA